MMVNDINPNAVQCARDNVKDPRAYYVTGDGLDRIKARTYDLLICNPPYVPRLGSIDDNPYEGVSLLYHLLNEGKQYLNPGGILLTNVSSLCEDIVVKNPEELELLEQMTVPLKVNNILNNKKWIEYLLKEQKLQKEHRDGYDYWHTLKIYKLQK